MINWICPLTGRTFDQQFLEQSDILQGYDNTSGTFIDVTSMINASFLQTQPKSNSSGDDSALPLSGKTFLLHLQMANFSQQWLLLVMFLHSPT